MSTVKSLKIVSFCGGYPYGDKVVLLEGLEEAFLGILPEGEDEGLHAVYSREKLVKILMARDQMGRRDADEFIDYNIECLRGKYSPLILDTL